MHEEPLLGNQTNQKVGGPYWVLGYKNTFLGNIHNPMHILDILF